MNFQQVFEEAGYGVYEHRERIAIAEPVQTEAERQAEARRLAVNELMEWVRNRYWRVEEGGDENAAILFIEELAACYIDPVLNINVQGW